MDAVGTAARAIKSGEAQLMIAGGVESMSRAPFVMPKAESAFSRTNAVYDTTIGWRFVNPLMKEKYGVRFDARDGRERRPRFSASSAWPRIRMALRLESQKALAGGQKAGFFAAEIVRR